MRQSVHNQRIKGWREAVTQFYYRLFYSIDDEGILDVNKDTHLFALQYIYIPRINNTLQDFVYYLTHISQT